jgi:hypothetical protein
MGGDHLFYFLNCRHLVQIIFSNCVKEYNKLRKNLKQQFYNSFVNKINELHPNYSIKAFGNH